MLHSLDLGVSAEELPIENTLTDSQYTRYNCSVGAKVISQCLSQDLNSVVYPSNIISTMNVRDALLRALPLSAIAIITRTGEQREPVAAWAGNQPKKSSFNDDKNEC